MKQPPIKCLDHGFVKLLDVMGDDSDIVEAARISTQPRNPSEDQALINYLMRNQHWTPFEMCELKFHVKLPIFVMRQWIRHRTANVNEFSMRYREAPDEFHVPQMADVKPQSVANHQGRDGVLSKEVVNEFLDNVLGVNTHAMEAYKSARHYNIARETARMVLPVNIYTEMYWKIDLRNLFNFLGLRLDKHAQYEIRVYAEAIAGMVKEIYPLAWKAYTEYHLEAVKFSRKEIPYLSFSIPERQPTNFSKTEWDELLKKIARVQEGKTNAA